MMMKEDKKLKSDEYLDREKLGKAIIFNTGCNPYWRIEKSRILPREIEPEYRAWHEARKAIEAAKQRAIRLIAKDDHDAIVAVLRHHFKSK